MTTVLTSTTVAAGTTFLDLVNRARRECGVSNAPLETLQDTLSAESQRFKDWVSDAWRDLQLARLRWSWMRIEGSFQTVAGTWSYGPTASGITNLGDWLLDTFRAYRTAIGTADEMFLADMNWQDFRDLYQFGSTRPVRGRPINVAVRPDRSLAIAPVPDDVYTVVFEYQRAPSELVEDADDPCSDANGLPTRFYMLVVYGAMLAYADFEAAPEVKARAEAGWRRLFSALVIYSGGPVL